MKLAILGCKGTTQDLIHGLEEGGVRIDLVITLPDRVARRNRVAFFRGPEIQALCEERSIPLRVVQSYPLAEDADRELFRREAIDLLLVIGWERLLPGDILATLGRFACGMHGSPFGLPRGRGRSPMNWAILTGHRRFVTYLFRYNEGVDAGDVIGFKTFEINPFDSIATLHWKNRVAMQQLVLEYLPRIQAGEFAFWPQPPGRPSFYPRRRPEDGLIDWSRPTREIHDLVRAVAPPYPGAYCFLGGRELRVLEAQPFDSALFRACEPGTILDASRALGQFVARTGDGSLLVRRFEPVPIGEIHPGQQLEGGAQETTLARVRARYPEDLPVDEREI
jgi:UDP-4-amino-4-deoxy-L-arabinose formyltransferase/UDP-glucuronic acid dehydrogenase (UDP-4-keto-hexauronic acid decarboxylating)